MTLVNNRALNSSETDHYVRIDRVRHHQCARSGAGPV